LKGFFYCGCEMKKIKALGLCSGGLDSILSALVLRNQGIHVEWISFETPFFSAVNAKNAARLNKIPIEVIDITETYLKMLKAPPAGYGKNMNPCMDCHTLMFRITGKIMVQRGFDFLFSGEVVGQRPMSQTKQSLNYVENNSGCKGYIIRPLSGKLLPPSVPENEGKIDRDKLFDISGRSRKRQIELAKSMGVKEYPAPAGGCLLTDKGYCNRLKDLFEFQPDYIKNDLHILKYGRHFRINDEFKIIVGRTKKDNEDLMKYHNPEKDLIIRLKEHAGPTVLISYTEQKENIELAASICAGYSKLPKENSVELIVSTKDTHHSIMVKPVDPFIYKEFLL